MSDEVEVGGEGSGEENQGLSRVQAQPCGRCGTPQRGSRSYRCWRCRGTLCGGVLVVMGGGAWLGTHHLHPWIGAAGVLFGLAALMVSLPALTRGGKVEVMLLAFFPALAGVSLLIFGVVFRVTGSPGVFHFVFAPGDAVESSVGPAFLSGLLAGFTLLVGVPLLLTVLAMMLSGLLQLAGRFRGHLV